MKRLLKNLLVALLVVCVPSGQAAPFFTGLNKGFFTGGGIFAGSNGPFTNAVAIPGPSFSLPLTDAGNGAVNLTPSFAAGSATATFTRATTAYTRLQSGAWASVASGTARSYYFAPTGPSLAGITFFDNFARANTSAGDLGSNYQGLAYSMRGAYAGSYPLPAATDGFISSQKYTYGGNSTVYATQTLRGTVRRIGAKIQRRSLHVGASSATSGAMIISPNDKFINDMLHFTWSLGNWTFQIRQAGGAFVVLASGSFSPSLSLSTNYWFDLRVAADNQTVTISVPGSQTTVTDARVTALMGKYIAWEEFPNDVESNLVDVLDYLQVWAKEDGQTAIAANIYSDAVYGGYIPELSRTNEVLWNRDLTNVAWTPTSLTPALDQIGIDGTAASASSLLATGANATILQSITEAAVSRTFSAFVMRLAGTGEIDMTEDGGATWTDISSSINALSYTQVSIPAQSVLNPSVGFRIVTSGDQIAVDMVQNEAGVQATTPIPTTTIAAARNADVLTYVFSGNASATSGTISAEISLESAVTLSSTAHIVNFGGSDQNLAITSAQAVTTISCFDGTNIALKSALTSPATAVRKRASSWGSLGIRSTGDGASPATNSFDGSMASAGIGIGTSPAGAGQPNGTIRNVRIWPTQLPNATLQTITK